MNELLRFFEYKHLPEKLQDISRHFYYMAHTIDSTLVSSAEKTMALRKLLESKDCAVRAAL